MKSLDVMKRADCWSCAVMCEVMNNKHSVLHQTGLTPQPETHLIRLMFAVAKQHFIVILTNQFFLSVTLISLFDNV